MLVQGHLTANPGAARGVLRRLVLALWLLLPVAAPAADERGGFVINEAELTAGESAWTLSALIDVQLSSGAREALENGVPVVFEFQVQALAKQRWLWDQVIAGQRQRREVHYHPLSRAFIVRNLNNGDQRGYRSLEEAMESVGVLKDIEVLDFDAVDGIREHTVRLRGDLDIESLPTPIRLLAYLSPAWRMKSEWVQWRLER